MSSIFWVAGHPNILDVMMGTKKKEAVMILTIRSATSLSSALAQG